MPLFISFCIVFYLTAVAQVPKYYFTLPRSEFYLGLSCTRVVLEMIAMNCIALPILLSHNFLGLHLFSNIRASCS